MQEERLSSSDLLDKLSALSTIQSDILTKNEYRLTKSKISSITTFLQKNIDNGAFDAVPKMEHALSLLHDIVRVVSTNKIHDCTMLDKESLLQSFIDTLKLSSDASTASFSSFFSHKCYENMLNILNYRALLEYIVNYKLSQSLIENIGNAIKNDKTSTITQSLAIDILCKTWPLLDPDQAKLASAFIPVNLKVGLNKYSDYEGSKLPMFIRKHVNLLNDDNSDIHSFQFKSIYLSVVQNNTDEDDDGSKRVIYENIWVDFEKTIMFQFDDFVFRIDYKDIISVKNKDKIVMLIQLQCIYENIQSLISVSELPNHSQSLYICFETTKSKSKLLETVINRVNSNVLKAHSGNESTKYSTSFSRLYINSQVETVHEVDYDMQDFDVPLYQPDSPQTSLTASKSSADYKQIDSPKTYPQDTNGDRFDSGLSSKASTPSSKSKKSLLKSQIITKKVVPIKSKANMQFDSVSAQKDDYVSDSASKSPTTRSSIKKLNLSTKSVESKVAKAKKEPKLSKLITKTSSSVKTRKDLKDTAEKSSLGNNHAKSLATTSMYEVSTPPKRRSYKSLESTKKSIKDTSVVQQPALRSSNKFKPKMRSSMLLPTKRNDYLSDDDIQVTGETPEKIVKASFVTSKTSTCPAKNSETTMKYTVESIINNNEVADYAPEYDYGHDDNYNIAFPENVAVAKSIGVATKEKAEKPQRKPARSMDNTSRNGSVVNQNSNADMKSSSLLQKASGREVQISDEARRKSDSFMRSISRGEVNDDRSERSILMNDSSTIATSAMTTATTITLNTDVRKNKQRGQQLMIGTKKKVEVDSTIDEPINTSIAFNDDYEKLFARPKLPRSITSTVTPKAINVVKCAFVPLNPTPLRNKRLKQTSPSTEDISSDYSMSDCELDSDDDITQQKYEIIVQFNQMRKEKICKKARKEMDDIESVALDQIGSYLLQWIEIIKNSKVEFENHFKNAEYAQTIKIHNNFTEKVNNEIPQLQNQQKESNEINLNLAKRFNQLSQLIVNDLKQFERDKNDLQFELGNKKKKIDKKSITRKQKIPSEEKAELFKKALGL